MFVLKKDGICITNIIIVTKQHNFFVTLNIYLHLLRLTPEHGNNVI